MHVSSTFHCISLLSMISCSIVCQFPSLLAKVCSHYKLKAIWTNNFMQFFYASWYNFQNCGILLIVSIIEGSCASTVKKIDHWSRIFQCCWWFAMIEGSFSNFCDRFWNSNRKKRCTILEEKVSDFNPIAVHFTRA